MRWREAVFHPFLPVCPIFLSLCLFSLSPSFSSLRNLNLRSQILPIIRVAVVQFHLWQSFSICMILRLNSVCVFSSAFVSVWLQGSCWEWLSPLLAEQSDCITRRQWWPRYCSTLTGFAKPSGPVCTEGSNWTVHASVICGPTKWPFLNASSPLLSAPWVTHYTDG